MKTKGQLKPNAAAADCGHANDETDISTNLDTLMSNLASKLDDLLESEDSTGCEGDLTVISRSALADCAEAAIKALRGHVDSALCDRMENYVVNHLGDEDNAPDDSRIPLCDQCEMLNINGVNCHESGCPNRKKTWMPDREAWVLFLQCRECGCDVEAGESCDCQDVEPEPEPDEDEDEADPDNYIALRGGCCEDCRQAISNDDYSGMDDDAETRVRDGLKRINQWLIVGEEMGFQPTNCEVCGDLAGDRWKVGYLVGVATDASQQAQGEDNGVFWSCANSGCRNQQYTEPTDGKCSSCGSQMNKQGEE